MFTRAKEWWVVRKTYTYVVVRAIRELCGFGVKGMRLRGCLRFHDKLVAPLLSSRWEGGTANQEADS